MTNHLDINISVVQHTETGLIVATSDQLKGLIVHGRSMAEVEKRIPETIRALLEADGKIVLSITHLDQDEKTRKAGFTPTPQRFSAELCEAA